MAVAKSKVFDCDKYHLLDGDDSMHVLPCMDDGPSWELIGHQLLGSLIFFVGFMLLNHAASKVYAALREAEPEGAPPLWARAFVGTVARPPEAPLLEQVLELAQLFGSSALVWTWISSSYRMGDLSDVSYSIDVLAVVACLSHRWFQSCRYEFSSGHASSLNVFLDCLTLPQVLMRASGHTAYVGGGTWLTLAYLRTFHMLAAVKRMRGLKLLDVMSDFSQAVFVATLECMNVVFTIAGTMWVLEGLGDIEGFQDAFMNAGMGSISFFQMVYFTFITISTVGYGDFSPSTVPSRIFVVFAIFAGVSFFSYMSVNILELMAMEASGRGKFRPKKLQEGERGHILIFGGGVTAGSVTVLQSFLQALCRDGCPEIVLMSQAACSDAVRDMLKEPWVQHQSIHFFVGSPLNTTDMERVRANEASVSFILADFETADTVAEDQRNMMIAAALSRNFPALQNFLMFVGLPALEAGSQIGLSEFNAYSIEALKASLMGSSLRCPGFSTMVLNLSLPDLPDPASGYKVGLKSGSACSRWLLEYTNGSNLEPYGFLPRLSLVGLTFKDAAVLLAKELGILLIAGQIDGGIVINPGKRVVTGSTVLFALADDAEHLASAAANGDSSVMSWQGPFNANRRAGSFGKRQRAKVVKRHSSEALAAVREASLFEEGGGLGGEGSKALAEQTAGGGSGGGLGYGGSGGGTGGKDGAGAPPAPRGGLPVVGAISAGLASSSGSSGGGSYGPAGSMTAAQSLALRSASDQTPVERLDERAAALAASRAEECRRVCERGGHVVVIVMEDTDSLDQQTVWEQLEVIVETSSAMPKASQASQEASESGGGGGGIGSGTTAAGSGGSNAPEAEAGLDVANFKPLPVVVLHSRSAVPMRKTFLAARPGSALLSTHVYFLIGPSSQNKVLQAAGLDRCARLLTLAPSAPPPEITPNGNALIARSDAALDEGNLMMIMVVENHQKVTKAQAGVLFVRCHFFSSQKHKSPAFPPPSLSAPHPPK